jgi:hypothetical protein
MEKQNKSKTSQKFYSYKQNDFIINEDQKYLSFIDKNEKPSLPVEEEKKEKRKNSSQKPANPGAGLNSISHP